MKFDLSAAVAELFINSVIVNTAFEARRTTYDVGIGYDDDIERAKQLIVEAIRSTKGGTRQSRAGCRDGRSRSIDCQATRPLWSHTHRSDVMLVQVAVIDRIKRTLTEGGISLPYPIETVLFRDETERRKDGE